MKHPNYLRVASGGRCLGARLVCCALLATTGRAALAQAETQQDHEPQAAATQAEPVQVQPAQSPESAPPATPSPVATPTQAAAAVAGIPGNAGATPSKRQARAAEDAYLAGAKQLEHDDLNAAEREFARALRLDPGNREYAIAIAVAREHRLTELVQQAGKARLAGDGARADTLLAEALAIDPENPIVIEHSGSGLIKYAGEAQPPGAASRRDGVSSGSQLTKPLTDRAQLLRAGEVDEPWRVQAPALAGALQLRPAREKKSFHLRGDTQDVVRQVMAAYGIRVVFDDPIIRESLRFDLEDQPYEQAVPILMSMTRVFAVPIDETSVLIAQDNPANRQRLERQLQETIFLPGWTPEQINELGNVLRNVFGVTKTVVQPGLQSIAVIAPEDTLTPMNQTLADLIDGGGEVMIEVKLYEVDTTRSRNIGATIPQQFSIFNVDAAANSIVNANQAVVQQAIAQGFVTASTSNLEIALALIQLGLVQSNLATNLLGIFGGGLTQTGVSGSVSTTFSLALNSADSRALDDVQIRVGDRQPATFRTGTKYPITTSTYTTGLSTPASTLSNATINGVSVSSLLSQFAGGSSATIPQVSYEDLGVTLKATPMIQKSGRIYMVLDMKIEALAGGSVNGIPLLASRQFSSNITVGDGESAMMVSNMNSTESAAVAGIPGLSELPGFQAPIDQNAEKDTGQLVVVVTPHVVRKRSNMVAGPRILIRAPQAAAVN
jgi:general secretion pathway protein D